MSHPDPLLIQVPLIQIQHGCHGYAKDGAGLPLPSATADHLIMTLMSHDYFAPDSLALVSVRHVLHSTLCLLLSVVDIFIPSSGHVHVVALLHYPHFVSCDFTYNQSKYALAPTSSYNP